MAGSISFQAARNRVTIDGEIAKSRRLFNRITDYRAGNIVHQLSDVFMSGLAMFLLKYHSLLDFEQQTIIERENLKQVFGIASICSDTNLRTVLDKCENNILGDVFAERFKDLGRTGLLNEYEYHIGTQKYLIVSCDGVQHFSSKRISCPCCLDKRHKDGSLTYHHNMLCSALVHPNKREVFILASEPIVRQDGATKNDCELNAAKRLYQQLDENYLSYKKRYNFLVVEDALYANAPHLRHLQDSGYSFIINVKPDSHKSLFAHIEGRRSRKQIKTHTIHQDGCTHYFEWVNHIPLNNTDGALRINFLHYQQTNPKGKNTTFTWVTDIKITSKRCYAIMRTARARWKIENETFNTLKNLGYHFEHNYGHGKDHLATTLAYLMLLALHMDQFVQACCKVFKALESQIKTKIKLWATIKSIFQTTYSKSMDFIYRRVAILFQVQLE
ncbi:MAG: transposase [Bacteroidota bacterium]